MLGGGAEAPPGSVGSSSHGNPEMGGGGRRSEGRSAGPLTVGANVADRPE